jgi:hypothetical protein
MLSETHQEGLRFPEELDGRQGETAKQRIFSRIDLDAVEAAFEGIRKEESKRC